MSAQSCIALLESCHARNILFVGDNIVDEYVYVSALGKSPKENLIPVKYHGFEIFHGGTHAAANHCRSFFSSVTTYTPDECVKKTRMVDKDYLRKLFEIHYNGKISQLVPIDTLQFDAVVVTDFGHGAIEEMAVQWLCSIPHLAVNAQTNSANIGFNLITKYPKADYVVIDEPEARLAARDRYSPIERVIERLAAGRYRRIIVTHGSRGAIGWDAQSGFSRIEAFEKRPLDTMGAGDAFFAITAPLAREASLQDLLLIGSAAAAVKTRIFGHRSPVTKKEVLDEIGKSHH